MTNQNEINSDISSDRFDDAFAVVEAFLDGERVDSQALKAALADAEEKAGRPLSLYQRKVLELYAKLRHYMDLVGAFRSPLDVSDRPPLKPAASAKRGMVAPQLRERARERE